MILERRSAPRRFIPACGRCQIDPGLLQMGERGADEASRNQVFTAKIVPIPSFGTKRIELEYQERLAVENYQSMLAVPLRPDAYQQQTAGHLTVTLELHSEHALDDFAVVSKAYPLQIREQTANYVRADFSADNVRAERRPGNSISLCRGGRRHHEGRSPQTEDGENFFQAMALLRAHDNAPSQMRARQNRDRTFRHLALDAMGETGAQFSGHRNTAQATAAGRPIQPDAVQFRYRRISPAPVPATLQNVEAALTFIRGSDIRERDGSAEGARRRAGADRAGFGESYIVVLSDGGATTGTVNNGRLAKWYTASGGRSREPHTYLFRRGRRRESPARRECWLRITGFGNGCVQPSRSISSSMRFWRRSARSRCEGWHCATAPAGNLRLVYPIEDVHFAGSAATWVGQYTKARTGCIQRDRVPIYGDGQSCPRRAADHPYLPRAWARARVDALLDKIARDGEDAASIDEIIRLSKKYKFVTPYTSFLAVPRALLRPRVIRPGDPVLRVKTDNSIVSVIAMFPFGLVKQMRYLEGEDAWQTRFLAPFDMNDGTYQVQLVLRDRQGHVYRESKSFVIASKAPAIRVKLGAPKMKAGGALQIAAMASANTRTITARLWGAEPVSLRWNAALRTNAGEIQIPAAMPAGEVPSSW